MKRREFITTTAGGATTLTLFGLMVASPVSAGSAVASPTTVARPGLPGKTREVAIACGECGVVMGTVVVDEMDTPRDVVCRECFIEERDQEPEECWECDEKDGEIEELQGEVDGLKKLEKWAGIHVDTLRGVSLDLRDEEINPKLLRRVEGVYETLDEVVRTLTS